MGIAPGCERRVVMDGGGDFSGGSGLDEFEEWCRHGMRVNCRVRDAGCCRGRGGRVRVFLVPVFLVLGCWVQRGLLVRPWRWCW